MNGTVSISQEGPKELDPPICEKEAIPDIVCLEERSGSAKLWLCLFQGAVEEMAVSRVAITNFQEESEGCNTLFSV